MMHPLLERWSLGAMSPWKYNNQSTPFVRPIRRSASATGRVIIVLVVFCSFLGCSSWSLRKPAHLNIQKRRIHVGTQQYPYYVFLPRTYTPSTSWPIVLYLHPLGAEGDFWDLAAGLAEELARRNGAVDFIAVVPSCTPGNFWVGDMLSMAVAAMDSTISEWGGDTTRLYVTGASMGGYGTWLAGVQYPDRFAALAPVCGGIVPPFQLPPSALERLTDEQKLLLTDDNAHKTAASRIGSIPSWVFHGARDRTVPVEESRHMVRELQRIGGNVKYTEYPYKGHHIWDRAYQELLSTDWLSRHHRENEHTSRIPSLSDSSPHRAPSLQTSPESISIEN